MILGIAKGFNDMGARKLATKVLESCYGKQIGKTSSTGMRGFQNKETNGILTTTVIDKNFNIIGKLEKKDLRPSYVKYRRTLYGQNGNILSEDKLLKQKEVTGGEIIHHSTKKYSSKVAHMLTHTDNWKYDVKTGTRQKARSIIF